MASNSVISVPAGVPDEQLHSLPIKLSQNAWSAQLREKWLEHQPLGTKENHWIKP